MSGLAGGERVRLVVIVGPTAAGKTELALRLAQHFGGEIVSADSMQVYRHMDIGTAKPSPAERAQVRHHLLDRVDPDEPFDAARFMEDARAIVRDLARSGTPVFVVGGTGLYVRALLGGLVSALPADENLRAAYRRQLRSHGVSVLYSELQNRDSRAAQRIHPNDAVRIIRALEVITLTGRSLLEAQARHNFSDHPYDSLKIGLALPRPVLFDRIERRTQEMVRAGWREETKRLLDMGYATELKPMQSLGYRHMIRHLHGEIDLEETVRRTVRDTRMYAKRQETWFRADSQILWYDGKEAAEIENRCRLFLKGVTRESS
jgi:tRNA dimethylallyltransferase